MVFIIFEFLSFREKDEKSPICSKKGQYPSRIHPRFNEYLGFQKEKIPAAVGLGKPISIIIS
jgi:hypothetical protein